MAEKKTPLNPKMDEIIRAVVKEKGYKLDRKETDVTDGTYGIEIVDEDLTFFVYLNVYADVDMVTFTTVVDELSERAEKIGICDLDALYQKVANAVSGYSFALRVDEDYSYFVEFRYTALKCDTEEAVTLGIDTCIDASCDYIAGLEDEVGLKY